MRRKAVLFCQTVILVDPRSSLSLFEVQTSDVKLPPRTADKRPTTKISKMDGKWIASMIDIAD